MLDIGMSSDYRSGVSEIVVCELCSEDTDGRYLEYCAYCGRTVCPHCYVDHIQGVTCLDCLGHEDE